MVTQEILHLVMWLHSLELYWPNARVDICKPQAMMRSFSCLGLVRIQRQCLGYQSVTVCADKSPQVSGNPGNYMYRVDLYGGSRQYMEVNREMLMVHVVDCMS